MLLQLVAPLLYSSALFTAPPRTPAPVETQEVHKESHKKNDPTILAIVYDEMLGDNCVSFVRSIREDAPNIMASDYPVTSQEPFVGAIGKMYYPRSGLWHVFIVEAVVGSQLTIRDSNYEEGFITTRVIDRASVVGYY